MRIHVLGREYDALRSAESFLQMAKAERLGLRVYKVWGLYTAFNGCKGVLIDGALSSALQRVPRGVYRACVIRVCKVVVLGASGLTVQGKSGFSV